MINIINGKTMDQAQSLCLNKIKELRKSGKVIVICPDRMALQIENQIFDTLNVTSLFDCDVYTMSRLSLKVISKIGSNKKILSKQQAVTIIKKIIIENELTSFSGVINFNGFALKLFEIISMFKSCKLTPAMLLEKTNNQILKSKLSDLNIVYERYEEFLQNDYTDSFNKLDLFCSSVTDEFKDTHIIFVGFNDFTKQMLNIIRMFILKSKSVYVATASSYGFDDKLHNRNLYVNNVYTSLIELCKSNGFQYHIEKEEGNLIGTKLHILNNLYSYNPDKLSNNPKDLKVISFSKENSELDFVLKDIKYKLINNNLRYGDFSIAIPNLKEKSSKIKNLFNEFEIPCFLDISYNLNEMNISLFVNNIFECLLYNFKKEEFLNLIKNVYSNIDFDEVNKFETYINNNGITNIHLNNCEKFKSIKKLYENISILKNNKKMSVNLFIDNLFNVLEELNIQSINDNIINKLNEKSKIEDSKNYKMSYEKFCDSLNELKLLLNKYDTNLEEFYKILKVYLENVSITIPPIVGDVVMVYDINSSFIVKNDYMYILSAVEGLIPKVITDVSLVSDNEIGQFDEELRLNPTCNLINKRNKFAIFENLFKYNKQLTITYFNSIDGASQMPSQLITNLIKIFPDLEIINGDEFISNYNYFSSIKKDAIFELNNISKKSAYTNFINLTKNFDSNFNQSNFNKYYYSLMKALPNVSLTKEIINNNDFNNSVEDVKTNLFFNNSITSISEIEKYYNCPYAHFINNGLKLSENGNGQLQANHIGSIIHELLSIILTKFKNDLTSEDIKKLSYEIFNNIIDNEYADYAKNIKNKNLLKNLKDECYRVSLAMFKQQSESEFKNKYNEYKFSNIKELSVTKNGVTIFVKGFIDRIDVCDDMFALYDYKTGQDVFSFTDLYAGKKIQLLIYVKAAKIHLNKTPICACYIPINNNFSDKIENPYKIRGVFKSSLEELQKLDTTLIGGTKAENINIKINKDGSFDRYSGKYCLSLNEIDELSNYAFELVKKAINEILEGKITINPLLIGNTSACNYCKYKGICNFNTIYKNKYRYIDSKTSKESILNRCTDE